MTAIRKKYKALTVFRRGALSKKHLADPEVGLALELKKAQEPPVEVTLTLVKETDIPEEPKSDTGSP